MSLFISRARSYRLNASRPGRLRLDLLWERQIATRPPKNGMSAFHQQRTFSALGHPHPHEALLNEEAPNLFLIRLCSRRSGDCDIDSGPEA
jgi:hypothetical protein